MTMTICKIFRFEAAHSLPGVPPGHKCGRLHGHGYTLEVWVGGELDDAAGWLVDTADIAIAVARDILDVLDHSHLNEVGGLENPTMENVVAWIWSRLEGKMCLKELVLHETTTGAVRYRGPVEGQ